MVRFFDQKEEVINIELTAYGKQQFTSGTLSPAYYAFYDTSILYDGGYGGITETQNQVTNRISNETPRLQTLSKFSSAPGSVFSLATAKNQDDFSQENSWNSSFYRTLGSSDPNSTFNPAWKINVLELSDVGFNDGVKYNASNTIPQMSATLYIDYVDVPARLEDTVQVGPELILNSVDSFLLNVEELNTIFKGNGNFDIEVYVSGTDRINSLGFINDRTILNAVYDSSGLFNDIQKTINGSEQIIGQVFPSIDDNNVEFYLDILADKEIEEQRLPLQNSSLYGGKLNRDPSRICDD